jgi:hypothetical protein
MLAATLDPEAPGGRGSLTGFNAGCAANPVPAGGILTIPDYGRSCDPKSRAHAALALIHMPEADMWISGDRAVQAEAVRQVGINFGAPGRRLAKNGVLWVECPVVGKQKPAIPVALSPSKSVDRGGKQVSVFAGRRIHHASSRMAAGASLPWVGASGVSGVTGITVTLGKDISYDAPYTVRLVFAELQGQKPGQRVFDVSVQGKGVLKSFDIAATAGGAHRVVVKTVKGVRAGTDLSVTLTPRKGVPLISGLEIVEE